MPTDRCGIGKPLKNRVRNMWEDWMMSQGVGTAVFRPPPPGRSVVSNLVEAVPGGLLREILK